MDYEGCRGTGPYGDEASETDDENDEEVLACAYRFALPVGGFVGGCSWWGAIVCRSPPAQQLEANDGEVEKRKRDKTWNDVAAAQKRGVESQTRRVCRSDRHKLVSAKKLFVDWLELHSDHIVMGPTRACRAMALCGGGGTQGGGQLYPR